MLASPDTAPIGEAILRYGIITPVFALYRGLYSLLLIPFEVRTPPCSLSHWLANVDLTNLSPALRGTGASGGAHAGRGLGVRQRHWLGASAERRERCPVLDHHL